MVTNADSYTSVPTPTVVCLESDRGMNGLDGTKISFESISGFNCAEWWDPLGES